MRRLFASLIILTACSLTAHAEPQPEATKSYGPAQASTRLLVRGTTDIALFEPVLLLFADQNPNIGIEYEQWGSNDLYGATKADCESGTGAADLVVSSSIDQQLKLANDGCATPYTSQETGALPVVSNWRDEVFGITQEPAVIVYNARSFANRKPPRSRFDLIDLLRSNGEDFRGRVATYDIESSGLGYLFAFADAQQATTYGSLIEAFGRSEVVTSCCSSAIIDGVATGEYLFAYNVLGSYALARAEQNPDIIVVAPSDYTLVLSRAALIPKGAQEPGIAGLFIDFLLSEKGRAALRSSHLIVETDENAKPALRLPENPDASLRTIPLSPALLVGLDQHKRREFAARWRATLQKENGPGTSTPPSK